MWLGHLHYFDLFGRDLDVRQRSHTCKIDDDRLRINACVHDVDLHLVNATLDNACRNQAAPDESLHVPSIIASKCLALKNNRKG
jgi:hypothetical protein